MGENQDSFFSLLHLIKERKFKGYTGMAVKNGLFQFSTTLAGKVGSIIFTIIIARLLMPELFGLYSLALSTVVLFTAFADLGIQQTTIMFVSKFLGKNKLKKAKNYSAYLLKIKIFLVLGVTILLALLSKFLAEAFFQKPVFLALVSGGFFIISLSFINFIEGLFQASNNFKPILLKEIFFQIARLILVPATIILSLKYSVSLELNVFLIMFSVSLTYFLSLIFIFFLMKKKITFLNEKKENLPEVEKKHIKGFIIPLSATALSAIVFGYVDILMLGGYVLAEFIGYYRAAFSLMTSAAALITFSFVMFPIFSRLKGGKLKEMLKKSIRVTIFFSLMGIIGTLLLAPYIVQIVFGRDYILATDVLRILSLLLLSGPLTTMHTSYLISISKQKIVAKFLVVAVLLNVILNYFFIVWTLEYGYYYSVLGVAVATVISRFFYLGCLMAVSKK